MSYLLIAGVVLALCVIKDIIKIRVKIKIAFFTIIAILIIMAISYFFN